MKISSRYKDMFAQAKKSPAYWTERALLDIARQLVERMKELKISQKDVAERADKKAAYVSRVLSGRQNLTIETVTTVAHAMGLHLDVQFREIEPAKLAAPAPTKKVIISDSYSVHGIGDAQFSQVTVRHVRLAANNGSLTAADSIISLKAA